MRRPTPAEVGYALLLSVPSGVGATAFVVNLLGANALVYAFGAALTLGLFGLVVLIFTGGENATADPDAAGR